MEKMLVPTWLESLLSATFFNICPRHKDAPKYECNMFCLDCMKESFCSCCRSSEHNDHAVVQIRRSSYHNVVRVAEMSKVWDVSGIQTYIINSAKVVFLNARPPLKGNPTDKAASHSCEICGRILSDPTRFCSLGCKLVSIKKYGRGNFILNDKEEVKEIMGRRLPLKEKEEFFEGSQQDMYVTSGAPSTHTLASQSLPPPLPSHSNSKKRKGIPRRAPFGTI